jgi:hypothetical protein
LLAHRVIVLDKLPKPTPELLHVGRPCDSLVAHDLPALVHKLESKLGPLLLFDEEREHRSVSRELEECLDLCLKASIAVASIQVLQLALYLKNVPFLRVNLLLQPFDDTVF